MILSDYKNLYLASACGTITITKVVLHQASEISFSNIGHEGR